MQDQSDSRQAGLRSELSQELESAGITGPDAQGSGLFTGVVVDATGGDVVLELGPRVQGVVPVEEFDTPPAPGTELKVTVTGREDGLWLFSVKRARALVGWAELEIGSLVKGKAVGLNKGGLELKCDGIDAFLPASQVALHHVEDLAPLCGQAFVCEVLEIDREKRRIVVSRRAVLEEEARQAREAVAGTLVEGAVMRGKVMRLESYGAFVDIGGVEGLLHVSNLSHRRVDHPQELLKVGQDIEVQVIKIEEGGRRIGLGTKQLEADPWETAAERFHEDSLVNGTVRRLADFGAFVELIPGVDGLLHVSQLGPGRVHSPSEVLKVGEELLVRILSIDPVARRISLSRLDPRGAMLGSEDAVDGEEIDAVLDSGQPLGTNLGSLFQAALKKKES
jgi:ribosomal protein S1